MKFNIRLLYLYLFAFVGLLITIIGSIQLVDLGMKTYIFQVTDYPFYPDPNSENTKQQQENYQKEFQKEQENQRKRQMSTAFSMIIVGAPVYFYHWRTIKKENKS